MAVAILSYGAALFGDMVYDDLHSVRDNPSIRSLASIPLFFHDVDAFSSIEVRMYRPVLLLTFALDWFVGHGSAWVFKATNVLLHALNAVLVWSIARKLAARRHAAWLGAALFASHPLASEAVNMISSRSDLLAACGVLVGVRAYVAWQDGCRFAWVCVAAGAFVACGSKATGVMLAPMCVVLEFVRPGESAWRNRVLRQAPAAIVAAAYLLARRELFGIATARAPILTDGHDVLNGAGRDLVTQACVMANVLPRFVAQSIAPVGLSLDPWIPLHDAWWSAPVLCGWVAIGLLLYFGLRAPRRRPLVFLGTALALTTALPWIVVPLNLPALEHRFYLPLAGFACVIASVASRSAPSRVAAAAAVALVATFGGLSATRSLEYRDVAVLWRGALAQHPRSVRGLCGLALVHRQAAVEHEAAGQRDAYLGSMREACALLERAILAYPEHWAARRNLAEFHIKLAADGRPDYAVELALGLVEVEPRNPFYRLLLSRALTADARFDDAVTAALYCLEIAEPKGLVFRTAAAARAAEGDLAAAIALLDESVARGLDHESVLLVRADYLERAGDLAGARRDLHTILARDPFHGEALHRLDRVGRAQPPR